MAISTSAQVFVLKDTPLFLIPGEGKSCASASSDLPTATRLPYEANGSPCQKQGSWNVGRTPASGAHMAPSLLIAGFFNMHGGPLLVRSCAGHGGSLLPTL